MRNIDYYGTKLFLKSAETGGCLTGLVHEAKYKTPHYCSSHNSDCELCRKEAVQWLNEPFNRITEKEHQFLSMLNSKMKYIDVNDKNECIEFIASSGERLCTVNWNVFFESRPFSNFDNEEELSVEELLRLEVA